MKILFIFMLFFITGCNTVSDIDESINGIINVDSYQMIDDPTEFEVLKDSKVLEVIVSLTNQTQEDMKYNSQYIFAYDQKGNEFASMISNLPEGNPLLVGEIKPGSKVTGSVYFEIKDDQKIDEIHLKNEDSELISEDNLNE